MFQHNIKFANQTLSLFFPSFIVTVCCPRNTHQSWPIFGKLAEVPKPHVFFVPFQGEIFVSGLWMLLLAVHAVSWQLYSTLLIGKLLNKCNKMLTTWSPVIEICAACPPLDMNTQRFLTGGGWALSAACHGDQLRL